MRVFHARDFSIFDVPPLLNSDDDGDRSTPLNVYFSLEPPVHSELRWHALTERLLRRDFFNLSITYKSTADVLFPFDLLEARDGSESATEIYSDAQVRLAASARVSAFLLVCRRFFQLQRLF